MSKVQKQRVQTFGRKKTATAVAVCQQGRKTKKKYYCILLKKNAIIFN
jgi:ribosomal protein S9